MQKLDFSQNNIENSQLQYIDNASQSSSFLIYWSNIFTKVNILSQNQLCHCPLYSYTVFSTHITTINVIFYPDQNGMDNRGGYRGRLGGKQPDLLHPLPTHLHSGGHAPPWQAGLLQGIRGGRQHSALWRQTFKPGRRENSSAVIWIRSDPVLFGGRIRFQIFHVKTLFSQQFCEITK